MMMRFKPAPDITAYELASILQRMCGMSFDVHFPESVIVEWPKNLQRHWRKVHVEG